jgi:L-2-hydroxyglutarate oxidase LhgO
MSKRTFDVVIIGGGIVGLSLARELMLRNEGLKIGIFEKEDQIGMHSSGRNSGVLHSGIYYAKDSLKARLCGEGSKLIAEYCRTNSIPHKVVGKLILPTKASDDSTLDMLLERGRGNKVDVKMVSGKEIQEIEPSAQSITDRGLYIPGSTVVDSKAVIEFLAGEIGRKGCQIIFNAEVVRVSEKDCLITLKNGDQYSFGKLVNAAGLHADRIAHMCEVGMTYRIAPFKGLYCQFVHRNELPPIRGHIYPVPNLDLPFLGIHFTRSVSDKIYLGPNALPALGRENYRGLSGVAFSDAVAIASLITKQYWQNNQGFRKLLHTETLNLVKKNFINAARVMVPGIRPDEVIATTKVGMRAQLYNTQTKQLEMDFVAKSGQKSLHILNAISPAFSSSFSFAKHVLDTGLFPI